MKNPSTSTKIYLGLVLFLIGVKSFFLLAPVKFPLSDQAGAFSWLTILTIAALGFVGLVLSKRTGFPDIWDTRISNRQRLLIPAIIGLVYGGITVLEEYIGTRSHPFQLSSDFNVKFPLSIPFYAYGAIFLEILLRLFAIPFLVWLLSNVVLRHRGQTQVFWLVAILAALYEPLPYMTDALHHTGVLSSLRVLVGPLFVANLVAAYIFRKYGFLAPLVMRLSFYLIWHIIYGGLI
jgi:hypothetical protein